METASRYRSLRHSLLATMIVVPLLPFGLAVAIGHHFFTTSLHDEVLIRMTRLVEDHRRVIEMFLKERQADLQFLVRGLRFDQLRQPEVLSKVFEDLRAKSPAFTDLGVFDAAGIHLAYQGPYQLVGKAYDQAEWFKQVMSRGYYVSDIFLGFRNVPHFVIAVARKEPAGTWVLRATIDSALFTELVEKIRIGQTGEAYILNSRGERQTRHRAHDESEGEALPDFLKPHQGITTFVRAEPGNGRYLYATAWLKSDEWVLVVRQAEADALRALRLATYLVVLVAGLGGVVIVSLAFFMTNRTVRRLERTDQEKEQLNRQLVAAARLAEIGEMSAGFAHEINNPLQVIRAEQTLMQTVMEEMRQRGEWPKGESAGELEDSIRQIRLQVDRCAGITQNILKFARQKEPKIGQVDLSQFLSEMIALIQRKAALESVGIRLEVAPETPPALADPGQLQQVIINLLNNALDAITEVRHGQAGGEIRVGVRPHQDTVEIAVSDNGPGISPENMDKLFRPFFTTKPAGKGTGLGLSVCLGIVDKMGGNMAVQSNPGQGATFYVRLPKA